MSSRSSTLLWKVFCFTESINIFLSAFTGENVCVSLKKMGNEVL